MTVRDTMTALIARVRRMCGIHDRLASLATDQEIQDALDRYRMEVRTMPLRPQEAITTTGTVEWKIWTAPYEDWEDTVQLQTGNGWAILSPNTSDLLTGRWTFATHQPSTVYLTGFTYDCAGAAADICRDLANSQFAAYSFSAQGGSFNREQIRLNLLDMEKRHRAQQRPLIVDLYNTNATPNGG